MEFSLYEIKLRIAQQYYKAENSIKSSNTLCLAYLAWCHGFSKGKNFNQHIKALNLSDLIEDNLIDGKRLKKRKRGAMWKAKKIIEADNKESK